MTCAACRVLLEHLGFADTLEPLPPGPTPEASLDAAAASLAGTSLDDGAQPGADHGAGEAAEGLEPRDDADFFDQHQGMLSFIIADVGTESCAAAMPAAHTTVKHRLPAGLICHWNFALLLIVEPCLQATHISCDTHCVGPHAYTLTLLALYAEETDFFDNLPASTPVTPERSAADLLSPRSPHSPAPTGVCSLLMSHPVRHQKQKLAQPLLSAFLAA